MLDVVTILAGFLVGCCRIELYIEAIWINWVVTLKRVEPHTMRYFGRNGEHASLQMFGHIVLELPHTRLYLRLH